MDLIYMDETREEIGVLQHYILDFDVAKEKDFELSTLDDEILLKAGYWWYIDGTEYGGRIDKVQHDTKRKTVIYSGRNWRGLLNSKLIEPPTGSAYRYADGDIGETIQTLLEVCEFDDLFTSEAVDITTANFQYPRYCTVYEGIIALLSSNNCKLLLSYDAVEQRCRIDVSYIADHSDYLTYISDNSLNYVVSQRKNIVNHLVCMGQGDGEARAVIHLFLDENGTIQPYRKTMFPVRNTDYILDKSSQQIFGLDERAIAYDYPNAQITYNYVALQYMPSDWSTKYRTYFEMDLSRMDEELSSARYKNVEPVEQEVYEPLTEEPANWSARYSDYYMRSPEGGFVVAGDYTSPPTYERLYSQPDDWATNFGDYYYYHNDGTGVTYHSVANATNTRYEPHTERPSDWEYNFSNYYMLTIDDTSGRKTIYTKLSEEYKKKPTWKASAFYRKSGTSYKLVTDKKAPDDWDKNWGNYYIKGYELVAVVTSGKPEYTSVKATSSGNAPTWKLGKYYTKFSDTVAPPFSNVINGGEYYCKKIVVVGAPPFTEGMYYSYRKMEVAPTFARGKYYEKTEDWYKVLVEGGLERIEELNKSESQTVTLADINADIGDIVSGYDTITGIEVQEAVTNMIVKIKNEVLSIDYEVGGKI